MELTPAQTEDALRLSKSYGQLLANSIGSGKTRTLLAAFDQFKGHKIMIVVGPKRVVYDTWPDEINQVLPGCEYAFGAKHPFDCILAMHEAPKIVLYSFEELARNLSELTRFLSKVPRETIRAFVIDEAHLIKGDKAARTKALLDLRPHVNYIWAATGTPATTKAENLYTISELLGRPLASSKRRFLHEYCYVREIEVGSQGKKFTMEISDGIRPDGYRKLAPWFEATVIRRPPDESHIPTAIFAVPETVCLTSEQKELYSSILQQAEFVTPGGRVEHVSNILTQLIRLRQVVSGVFCREQSAKEQRLWEILPEICEGRKVIVFSPFVNTIRHLDGKAQALGFESVAVTGATSNSAAKKAFADFKKDAQVLFISGCASVGLNLQHASGMVVYDRPDGYDKLLQLWGRIIRRGQTKHAYIATIVADCPIETWLSSLLGKKEEMMACVDALGEGGLQKLKKRLKLR